ncbi:Deoxyribodipyrimidine photolyase [Hahella chejuensis KCTC 2396]|uniref:Deoxyribodipyrimidine photo-lyase n=1 Tax=Hahella chejuensis (strain KCTC 2396) TaxID=349521 RepID=Q2SL92_HAHCH|nr:deoxyribodipyrimidine photo-lyase [Hahella chejuensis]ABC28582.1 Deoxyribodipyrimidine photolyase [Hahella chejuensis KCTC 2396]
MPRTLHWFRNDLRTRDNPALYAAAQRAREQNSELIACFLVSPEQWRSHDMADIKLDFMLRNLKALQAELAKLNIPLFILDAPRFDEAPTKLLTLMQQHQCSALTFNEEFGVNERRRDKAVKETLNAEGLEALKFRDQSILPAGSIRTGQGTPYAVFTPYKRAWFSQCPEHIELWPEPAKQPSPMQTPEGDVPESVSGFDKVSSQTYAAGEDAALQKLDDFLEHKVDRYHEQRDFPAIDGVSQLSPYLALGVLSGRQCFHAAQRHRHASPNASEGVDTWINELIWRDFYIHILYDFPRISMTKAFKQETENLQWRHSEKDFLAWCEGKTGIPIVDAAMRQLNQTGWMHNRLRMICAMFLSKNLLLDWRLGERYFMCKLIDGHLAANNGGWQWSASTGVDAAPYFRMFNPVAQSERFDPNGDFIRHYAPELAELSAKLIHQPPSDVRSRLGYPVPIVDLKASRERALQAFRELKNSTSSAHSA